MRNIFRALTFVLFVSSAAYADAVDPSFITVTASVVLQPLPVEGDFYTLDSNTLTTAQLPDGSVFSFGFTTAGDDCIFHSAQRCGASNFTDECQLQRDWDLYFVWNIWRCQKIFP